MGDVHDRPPNRLVVTTVIRETPTSVSLTFARPRSDEFQYRPGQFLTLRIPSDECGAVARCYSLSSSPSTDDDLKVTVKRTRGGYASNWICDHVSVGTSIEVLPPAGTFTPRSYDDDLLMFAGGSGITPILSIVKSVLAEGSAKIVVVYANRGDEDVIFARDLDRLCRAYPDRLTVIHWLESLQGLPTPDLLAGLIWSFPATAAFLCGPAPFMAAVRDGLALTGFDQRRVYAEIFTSLSGDPFAVIPSPDNGSEPGDLVKCRVELDGRSYTLDWPRDVTLLDLLLHAGIDAPHACREGECGACACTVIEGEVAMDRSDVLDAEDIGNGVALGCQARPVTDEVTVTFQ